MRIAHQDQTGVVYSKIRTSENANLTVSATIYYWFGKSIHHKVCIVIQPLVVGMFSVISEVLQFLV